MLNLYLLYKRVGGWSVFGIAKALADDGWLKAKFGRQIGIVKLGHVKLGHEF